MPASIYELVNLFQCEVYMGVTELPMDKQLAQDKVSPPAPIRHWNFTAKDILPRQIESFADIQEASQFFDAYLQARSRAGWKITRADTNPPAALAHSRTQVVYKLAQPPQNPAERILRLSLKTAGLLLQGGLLLGIGFATFIAAGLFVLPHLIDPIRTKEAVSAHLQEILQQPVEIGDITLTPRGLRLYGLKIGALTHSGRILECDTALVSMRSAPSLGKPLELDTIKLFSPRIHICRDEQGLWNFAELAAKLANTPELAAECSLPVAFASIAFTPKNISIHDGTLQVEDLAQHANILSGRIDLNVREFSGHSPFEFTLNFDDYNSDNTGRAAKISLFIEGLMSLSAFNWNALWLRPDKMMLKVDGKIAEVSGAQIQDVATLFLAIKHDASLYKK